MKTIAIALEVDAPLDVYTSGDTIEGVAVVTLDKDVSIGDITVSIQCKEHAEITHTSDQTSLQLKRDHKHFQNEIVVFPPEDIASTSRYHTLPQGRYEFPFAFQLPLDVSLPETHIFSSNSWVKWQLKAHVVRDAVIKSDGREWWNFRFVPARVPVGGPALAERKLVVAEQVAFKSYTEGYKRTLSSVFSNKNRLATMHEIEVYACPNGVLQWPLPSTLDIKMHPSIPDAATLRRLRLTLQIRDRVIINRENESRGRKHDLLDAKDLDILIGKELSLQRVLEQAGIGGSLQVSSIGAGSFGTLYNSREVSLRIDLYFGSRHYPGALKHRKLRVPVHIAPESVAALRTAEGVAPPAFSAVSDSDDEVAPPYEEGEKDGRPVSETGVS